MTEKQTYKGTHTNQNSIPLNPIEALSQGELNSPQVLMKEINHSNYRIASLEKDNKANNYIAITALGFILALVLKLAFDFYALDKGWNKAIEYNEKQVVYDSIVNQRLLEKKQLIQEIEILTKEKDSLAKK